MSVIESVAGKEHSSIRIYLFGCNYPNVDSVWLVEPINLIEEVRYKLDRIVDFSYTTIKVVNVRKSLKKDLEIHIDGVMYKGSDRLNSVEINTLRTILTFNFNSIVGFTFTNLDVVSDRFLERPTDLYTHKSMSRMG